MGRPEMSARASGPRASQLCPPPARWPDQSISGCVAPPTPALSEIVAKIAKPQAAFNETPLHPHVAAARHGTGALGLRFRAKLSRPISRIPGGLDCLPGISRQGLGPA